MDARHCGDVMRTDIVPYNWTTGAALRLHAPLAVAAGVVTPASAQADGSNLQLNQRAFAKVFAGFAGSAKLANDPSDTNFPVLRHAMMEFDCASTTFAVGDLLAPAASTGTVLSDVKMAKVTDPSSAIGVCVKAGTSLTRVKGFFFSRITPNNLPPVVGGVQWITETIARGDFTDGGSTSGFIDFAATNKLPAGALVLGWTANVTAPFIGDTSAVMTVGVSGGVNNFSAVTNGSVFTAGRIGSAAPVATQFVAATVAPRVTVTSAADFTNVSAGTATITIFYVQLY